MPIKLHGDAEKFVRMLDSYPQDMDVKYQMDNKTFYHHWLNEEYGGSILDPVINYEKVSESFEAYDRVEIPNSLRQDIADSQIKDPKYYVIQNLIVFTNQE